MYVDLVWLAEFIQLVGELNDVYLAIKAIIETPEPDLPGCDLTDEQRLECLKAATLLVAKLRLDIACYPLTAAAVVFYDAEGSPLPLECLGGE